MDTGNVSANGIVLAPGFRFHPMDDELITFYLTPKVLDSNFTASAIGDVDLNKVEPWELPWKAKMGENEWYFFCLRDKKYPTGLRTNRATAAGYWKATGKDKEIFREQFLIGMKKTLVFYTGRAPKGEKTNWIMHEYRLEGELSLQNLPKTARNEWVISRVFEKTSAGKNVHFNQLMPSSPIPDPSSPFSGKPVHVPCFSKLNCQGQGIGSTSNAIPTMNPQLNSLYAPNPNPTWSNMQYPNHVVPRDQSYLMNVEMMNNNNNNGQEENTNYAQKNEMENREVGNDEISPLVPNNMEMMNYRGRFDDEFDWTSGI